MRKSETVVGKNGNIQIPRDIRSRYGIETGSVLVWSIEEGVIQARKKGLHTESFEAHIRARAGTWKSKPSGEELLRKTRP